MGFYAKKMSFLNIYSDIQGCGVAVEILIEILITKIRVLNSLCKKISKHATRNRFESVCTKILR